MRDARRVKFALLLATLAGSTLAAQPVSSPQADRAADGWVDLFDPQLSRWELWMGVPHASVRDLPPGTPTSTDGRTGTPLGLANDPKHVFTLTTDQGEPVLHITGEIYGGLTTLAEFENYHLRFETKWGEKIWEPRLARPRDSGVLFHCTGPHGSFWNVWMSCLEFQVQENDIGDLYLLAGTSAHATSVPREKFRAFSPAGESVLAGATPDAKSGMISRSENFERQSEWNSAELYTVGDRAIFLVNGHVVNALTEARVARDTARVPLTRGKLQLQSEGSEVFYRRVQLRPITAFPPEILAASGFTPTPAPTSRSTRKISPP